MIELDDMDRRILKELERDGGLSAAALGARVGLTQPSAWRRVNRLKEHGVITGKRIVLDYGKLCFDVVVYLGVKLAAKGRGGMADFERAVCAIPEVQLVQHVLGVYDYRLKVVARDLPDFERILRRRIMTLPGVGEVESNILLSEER